MESRSSERSWFWATLILSCISIVALVFAAWELVENRFFRQVDFITLHYLYITRGIASSLLLASWAAWYVHRQRRRNEEELHRSWEHYRGLLEASPGAVVLYDAAHRVSEWNATAEKLYGFTKDDVLGQVLPTVPSGKEEELRRFQAQVESGNPLLNVETLRRNKQGGTVEVEMSLLPFREVAGESYFLEVTSDIRERVRLRQKLLEIEKLTSMGKMAAGTAHHLNTPLAAMLLRVEMMRERTHHGACAADLARLEQGIRFCQVFVKRLLQFSRLTPLEKEPVEISHTLRSVVSFLSPSASVKRARVSVDLSEASGQQVLADRNLLETLFSTLFSNALDAIPPGGKIDVTCRPWREDWIQIRIADNGCGIRPADRPHVFEPFFTTKGAGKGTGLGLAIARNIVLEHGGSIDLECEPDHGTTVRIELPLCLSAPATGRISQ